MKITVEHSELLKVLSHVHGVVERSTILPILSNVLLRADDGKLFVRATDLDLDVTDSVSADTAKTGATTVPAVVLRNIVRKLPKNGTVTLETKGDTIKVQSGRSRFSLNTLPESDFPNLSSGEFSHRFTIAASDLKRLIGKVQFAISTETTRYYLNGIYLHAVEKALRAVATDGHRLAHFEMPIPDGAEGMPGVIVPIKAVSEVSALLDGGDVTIDVSRNKIRFTIGNVVLTSKLIDGTFPDYSRVIPVGNDKRLELDKRELGQAVDRVCVVLGESGRAVKLSLTQSLLVLSVTNPDSGSATEELDVSYGDESFDIGFNSRYLLDVLSHIDGDKAVLNLAGPGNPALIPDGDALYVLMPMRA